MKFHLVDLLLDTGLDAQVKDNKETWPETEILDTFFFNFSFSVYRLHLWIFVWSSNWVAMSYTQANSPTVACVIPACLQERAPIKKFSVCCWKENVIPVLQFFFTPSVYPDSFDTSEGASYERNWQ